MQAKRYPAAALILLVGIVGGCSSTSAAATKGTNETKTTRPASLRRSTTPLVAASPSRCQTAGLPMVQVNNVHPHVTYTAVIHRDFVVSVVSPARQPQPLVIKTTSGHGPITVVCSVQKGDRLTAVLRVNSRGEARATTVSGGCGNCAAFTYSVVISAKS